ncbi:MAG: hypothetical protein JRN62_02555 [Nitrososphaerota archaeon]|jgi:hypothetical protein|nr:hypothetical protein [Nitrososphaerota archaeon]MDG6948883.1 hypothetical protein [Nitrososphaerota archaeon]
MREFVKMAQASVRFTVFAMKCIFSFYMGLFVLLTPSILAYGILNHYLLDLVVGPVLPFLSYYVLMMFWAEKGEPDPVGVGAN